MSNELDDLKAALNRATPAPDARTRAAHLRLAAENFDALQGTRAVSRPTSDRLNLWAGFKTGVKTMFNTLTTRGALTASTALVAFGLIYLIPLGDNSIVPPVLPTTADEISAEKETPAPMQAAPKLLARKAENAPERLAPQRASGADADFAAGALAAAPSSKSVVAETALLPEPDTEAFANAPANPLKITADDPVSTFSIDVDTASYSVIRASLMRGQMPPRAAVRIEEMVNYFPYAYPAPEGDAPFRPTVQVMQTPWNPETKLVHIAIQGERPATEAEAPLNLVFLIDTSGSMGSPDKLPLLKQSFRLMLPKLHPRDRVAIVTYAGSAGQVLAPTSAAETATILGALDHLDAGGGTAGQAGLQQAYSLAESIAQNDGITRVILATDGDFNIGISEPEALKTFIAGKRDSGTYLSVLGFGRGNLDDATMQALAQNGNGQAAYIDTLAEAQKVLVDQLGGALFPIANDVKVQVEFNPAQITEYRLIGYETRALNREDFNNDRVDAGEIGAGHSVTAIYEVTPTGSPAVLNDTLRYGAAVATVDSTELGFLKLRYKSPGETRSRLLEVPILEAGPASPEAAFAAAIAGFGQLLGHSPYVGDWTYADAIAQANATKGDDPFGYRAEAITLMRLAETLSTQ